MRFSFKPLLQTMIVMALGFGSGGCHFVNYVFQTSMDREVNQAADESSILCFVFKTATPNIPAKHDVFQDTAVSQVASNLESGGRNSGRLLRICDEQKNVLYVSTGFGGGNRFSNRTGQDTRTYRVIEQDGAYYIQIGTAVNVLDRVLYPETVKDVSEVLRNRSQGSSVYRRVIVVMLLCSTAIIYLIASFLTRSIRLLTRATKRTAPGDYHHRARRISNDEPRQLTTDFNQVASALEDNINRPEDEVRAKKDFVIVFIHELKASLTSIIDYVDVLRSHRLDEEKRSMSTNYIYTGGGRLEAMSSRLLDTMVTRRGEVEFTMVSAESLFLYPYDVYVINKSMKVHFNYDDDMVRAEANLIKSVLMNLLDNAPKVSEAGGFTKVYDRLTKGKYCFEVKDYGVGTPKEELHKITKAFYVVDKPRSRSRNGAGPGLTLYAGMLELHKSRLNTRGELRKRAIMSFALPLWKEDQL